MAEQFYIEQGTGKQLSQSQLTPGKSYIQSGTGASYTAPQASVPVSQSPITPVPQVQTPVAPQVPVPQQAQQPTSPVTVNVGTQQGQQPQQQQQKQQPLAIPQSGSVVDLLNMAGQDSSYAARQQLAQQYGIQNYTGTAAQNQDLAKKFMDAYNAQKGTAAPVNGAEARSALGNYFSGQTNESPADPQGSYFDAYAGMNPIVKSLYDSLGTLLSTTNTRTSLVEEYNQLRQAQGIPGLETDLMNMNRIMEGTEDDIRNEIQNVGGFATESQVQALSAARNKTLLKQAKTIQDQLNLKKDYVDEVVRLTGADREQVDKDLDRKLGIADKIITLQNQMDTAARTNYQKIVEQSGYEGLANLMQGDKKGQAQAEQILSLPRGALSNQSWLSTFGGAPTKNMTSSIQEYEYAKSQGYKGTFNQYQTEDANRKAKVAGAGVAGLTSAQINATVNQIAGSFDSEQIVKDYNQASSALRGIETIGTKTKSPTDDMAFIYAFAKIMDPNSVVREGEYKTVQDYGQALVQKAGLNLKRITDNSNFLTEDAKAKMLATLQTKVGAMKKGYDQVAGEYQRQIDDAYAGKPRQITNYATTVGSTDDQLTKLKSQLQPGEILVARETPTGRKYMAITPDELWATDITF